MKTGQTYYSFARLMLLTLLLSHKSYAQPARQLVNIHITPDHKDWVYKIGEIVSFDVSISINGIIQEEIEARYELGPDLMPPIKSESLNLKKGSATVKGGTMRTPGFLRLWVYAIYEGQEYRECATAAFEPATIQPTAKLPTDFTEFWKTNLEKARELPLNATMTLIPEKSSLLVDVYHISYQNERPGSRMYGILCMPKSEGKKPAILSVPGAGVRPYHGVMDMAEKGIITLQVGIHGVPVNMPQEVYDNLRFGALDGYPHANLDNRDAYYFKRVFTGCARAVDFIFDLPEFDGENLAIMGGSQGGALSITTAALDNRIKYLAAFYPALCDLPGFAEGNRAGGWPHMFRHAKKDDLLVKQKIANSAYFDVVNFARQITIPGWYSWGFNDVVCPPTSMYAAFNVIDADKKLSLYLDTGHWTYPEQRQERDQWVLDRLLK
ncbi:MAG: acetylxylan esterase [Cyclobacteriaceae bacterium]